MTRPKHPRAKPIVLSFKAKLALFEFLTKRCKKCDDGWVEYDPPGTDVSVSEEFLKLHPEWQITVRHVEMLRLENIGSLRTKANLTRKNGGGTDERLARIEERLDLLENLLVAHREDRDGQNV